MYQTVAQILSSKPGDLWSVSPDATVYEAIELMAEKSIGAVLVISQGVMVGIVTERDYARKVILQGRSSKETRAWQIMSRGVITVDLTQSVDDCLRTMTRCRIRHLPVLDGSRLAGMVSIGDLVKAIISDQAQTISQLNSYIGNAYPG